MMRRRGATGDATQLPTEAELEILNILWAHGPSTVRDVHTASEKDTGYTTVLKQMQVMAEKGLLKRSERYRSHVYEARIAKEQTQRQLARNLVRRAFDGSAKNLVLGALSSQKVTASDLAEIRRMLDEYEEAAMTTLVAICGQPLVHALGWTLLHLCWQGTLVAAGLWFVLGVLGGRSSRARYAAACLALGLMIALPLATFAHLASVEYRMRAAFDGPAVVLDPGMVVRVGAGELTVPWPERIAVALDHALPWMMMAWFAGVVLFVARLNVGLMVARRMRLVATTAVPAELQQAFEALRRRLGVARAVRPMHSALVQAPTVIGWLRPVVLAASCLTGLSTMQIEAVVAHEPAHIRRHDYLVSVMQSVIETLLFDHPAVWWVSRQVRRERECCCDEMAVAVGGDRLAYARALSVLEERRVIPGDGTGSEWRSTQDEDQTVAGMQGRCGGLSVCGVHGPGFDRGAGWIVWVDGGRGRSPER